MNEKILEITKNKDYLTELLSKNTLEEIVEFCKSKGVALTIDDAKEFVELIQSLKVQAQKNSASKEKLNDDVLVDKVVGGYHTNYYGEARYDTLDEKIRHEQSTAKTVVKSILSTVGGLTAIAAAGGLVYYAIKKDAAENNVKF